MSRTRNTTESTSRWAWRRPEATALRRLSGSASTIAAGLAVRNALISIAVARWQRRLDEHQPAHPLGVRAREPQRDQRAPAVADEVERRQVRGQRVEIGRERRGVVAGRHARAAAVPAQVVHPHPPALRERRPGGEVPAREAADHQAVDHHARYSGRCRRRAALGRTELLHVVGDAVGDQGGHEAMNSTSSPTVSWMI